MVSKEAPHKVLHMGDPSALPITEGQMIQPQAIR